MAKRKFGLILLSVVMSLQLCKDFFLPVCAEEQKDLNLYAKSAVLMDAESGRVLYEKDGNIHMPNASTTKIMTCILAIENGNLEDEVKVSSYAASMPKVRLGMSTEDTFYLKDLLYSLMLESHNDSAVAIAEHIGGSVEGFATMMNQKAKELGCTDTYFITPNGLDARDDRGVHGTTATDLAQIMSYCIKDKTFLEITQTASYSFSDIAGTKTYNCNNHNAFLQMMDGALSGKTGFTGNAGYCYVGALQWEGKTLIVSLLACGWPNNRGYKWEDTRKLMTYGLANYEYRDVFEQKDLGRIAVLNGRQQGTTIDEVATTSLEYGSDVEQMHLSLLLRKDEQITVHYQLPPQLEAPVRKGQQIGVAQYFLGKELLQEYPIYAGEQVDVRDYYWCLEQIGAAYCA